MARHFTAQRVADVSQTASVSDYDELPEDAQQTVRKLAAGEVVAGQTAGDVAGEVVRFGEYYRIERVGRRAAD